MSSLPSFREEGRQFRTAQVLIKPHLLHWLQNPIYKIIYHFSINATAISKHTFNIFLSNVRDHTHTKNFYLTEVISIFRKTWADRLPPVMYHIDCLPIVCHTFKAKLCITAAALERPMAEHSSSHFAWEWTFSAEVPNLFHQVYSKLALSLPAEEMTLWERVLKEFSWSWKWEMLYLKQLEN